MTELKEYTGKITIDLEVSLLTKSKKEALELLEKIYPLINLSYEGEIPELIDWDTHFVPADWELQ